MTLAEVLLALLLGPPALALLITPVFVLRFLAAAPRLANLPLNPPPHWPRLSVVSPARNEAATLAAASATRLALDYPDLQLVLVDDRSDDGTGALVDELAAADSRVTAMHVTELPEGWLGKNHALHVGAVAATGEWILFSDADVHLAPDALLRAVAHAEANGIDFLAVFPDLNRGGLLLNCLISSFGRMFSLATRPWKVQDPKSTAAVGVGAFNLVRRSALEASEGLPWLAYDVADDLALGVLMKRSGARCAVARGGGLVHVTWYETLGAMFVGLEKNTYPTSGCSFPRMIFFALAVAWLELSPFVALWPLSPGLGWLRALSAVALGAGAVSATLMSRAFNRPLLPALLTPLGTVLYVSLMLRSGWLGWRRGGISWRGTFYPSALLKERSRVTF